jgi:hypothetical protein
MSTDVSSDSLILGDTDNSEVEDVEVILSSLRRTCANLEKLTDASYRRFKTISKRAKQEVTPLRLQKLQPKPAASAWLRARKLSARPTFRDFFEAFLHEHAKEHRLELTSRSILLNEDACRLFRVDLETSLTFYELLEKLPTIFD